MIRTLPVLVVIALTGCSTTRGDYPSLQPRPIESRSDAEPVVAPVVVVPDPALDTKVAEATKALAVSHAAFDAADQASAARIGAARRAAVGSDAWLDAQTALAELDEHRSRTLDLLADAEALASARAAEGLPLYPSLEAVRVDTEVELDRQTKVVAERKAAVPNAI